MKVCYFDWHRRTLYIMKKVSYITLDWMRQHVCYSKGIGMTKISINFTTKKENEIMSQFQSAVKT